MKASNNECIQNFHFKKSSGTVLYKYKPEIENKIHKNLKGDTK